MKLLTRSEELLLLAVWKLQKNSYGVTIRDELKKMTKKEWAFGALFVSLERLVQKNLLTSFLSDPTPERGGRSKRIYKLTKNGLRELKNIKALQESIWQDVPELNEGKLF